jgi:hypothetical protein
LKSFFTADVFVKCLIDFINFQTGLVKGGNKGKRAGWFP